MANKIYTNHTLEEYKKKYRNRQYRLLKVTKKEVEGFHKKNPTVSKDYLLKDRKWWLIGDTYYEIPKAPRYTWFRNLNAGVQIATCALLGAAVATAVVVPTVIAINNHKSSTNKAVIDGTDEVKNNITVSKGEIVSEGTKYTVTSKTTKDFDDLTVTMGKDTLKAVPSFTKGATNEYKITQENNLTFNIIISKETIDAHANVEVKITIKLVVDPVTEKKINLSKTFIEVVVDGSEEIVASLSDKGTGLITAEVKSDVVTITAKGNNIFSVNGKKIGNTTITFECDGYKSATLNVTVKETPKKVVTKLEWVKKAKELCDTFNEATTIYDSGIKYEFNGEELQVGEINYSKDKKDNRNCILNYLKGKDKETRVIAEILSDDFYNALPAETVDGVTYSITDDEISYTYDKGKAPNGRIITYSLNKYGYLTNCTTKDDNGEIETEVFTYSKEPHEPVVEKKVILDNYSLEMCVDDYKVVAASLSDKEITKPPFIASKVIKGEDVIFQSSQGNSAQIYAQKEGSATIEFTYDGYESAKCEVTVKKRAATKDEFISKYDEFRSTYNDSTPSYTKNDITISEWYNTPFNPAREPYSVTNAGSTGNWSTKIQLIKDDHGTDCSANHFTSTD